ncbi:MAG TPA: hypothetical protein VLB79_04620 [Solirubrobacterales bacterium]|nr:hypothetical protein [Solirubrobacterales bacterium]
MHGTIGGLEEGGWPEVFPRETAVVVTVRDGRVVHMQGYMDQAAALEAAGFGSEAPAS